MAAPSVTTGGAAQEFTLTFPTCGCVAPSACCHALQAVTRERDEIEQWFKAGERARMDEAHGLLTMRPLDGSPESHWWTRGYAYAARQLRAIEAETSLAAVRRERDEVHAALTRQTAHYERLVFEAEELLEAAGRPEGEWIPAGIAVLLREHEELRQVLTAWTDCGAAAEARLRSLASSLTTLEQETRGAAMGVLLGQMMRAALDNWADQLAAIRASLQDQG